MAHAISDPTVGREPLATTVRVGDSREHRFCWVRESDSLLIALAVPCDVPDRVYACLPPTLIVATPTRPVPTYPTRAAALRALKEAYRTEAMCRPPSRQDLAALTS